MPPRRAPVNPLAPIDAETCHPPRMKRIAVAVAGSTVLAIGLAVLVFPILPGWLLIFSGLAVLAAEFAWARRLLDGAKARATSLTRR